MTQIILKVRKRNLNPTITSKLSLPEYDKIGEEFTKTEVQKLYKSADWANFVIKRSKIGVDANRGEMNNCYNSDSSDWSND